MIHSLKAQALKKCILRLELGLKGRAPAYYEQGPGVPFPGPPKTKQFLKTFTIFFYLSRLQNGQVF